MLQFTDICPGSGPPYPVYIGTQPATVLNDVVPTGCKQVAVIGDRTTSTLFAAPIIESLSRPGRHVLNLHFEPGEAHKSRATKQSLEDALLGARFDRSSWLVALGGGVALDVVGFVAATYMRGVAHVNVATSLLAQVDAAVGGKTGLNTPAGKNLVGAFHHPRAVLLDTGALASLCPEEMRNGLAEVVKHAALADAELFAELEQWAEQRKSWTPPQSVIGRCVQIKADVVAEDEHDHGRRQLLNFGHTVGHAIEQATQHTVAHGAAVACGMVVEARLAAQAGWAAPSLAPRLEALLSQLQLPTQPPCSFELAATALALDKKVHDGHLRVAAPETIGRCTPSDDNAWSRVTTLAQIAKAWEAPP